MAEGSDGAAGAAFFAYFLSLLKESRSGFGVEGPESSGELWQSAQRFL
jgi:hypothetical protein